MTTVEKVINAFQIRNNITIDKTCNIKKYVSTKEKFEFIAKYNKVLNKHVNDYPGYESFIAFIFFNLMVVQLYTDIELKLTYEEFDKLQSYGLINQIIDYVDDDYVLLLKLIQNKMF